MEKEAKLIMGTEAEPSNLDSWKSQIQRGREFIQSLKQGFTPFDRVIVEDCMQTLSTLV